MRKLTIQLLVLIAGFIALWQALSTVRWIKLLHISTATANIEDKLGELVLENYRRSKKEIDNDSAIAVITELKDRICKANGMAAGSVQVHIFRDGEMNAFSLPDSQVVINSGLITHCDSPEMLAGVLAHELAHIQHGHVARRIAREIGISSVMVLTGGENLEAIRKIVRLASSSHFDRVQEAEADRSAVIFLEHAGIDPKGLATVLEKLSEVNKGIEAPEWISTHPDAGKRAAAVLAQRKANAYTDALPQGQWLRLKAEVEKN